MQWPSRHGVIQFLAPRLRRCKQTNAGTLSWEGQMALAELGTTDLQSSWFCCALALCLDGSCPEAGKMTLVLPRTSAEKIYALSCLLQVYVGAHPFFPLNVSSVWCTNLSSWSISQWFDKARGLIKAAQRGRLFGRSLQLGWETTVLRIWAQTWRASQLEWNQRLLWPQVCLLSWSSDC